MRIGRLFIEEAFISIGYFLNGKYLSHSFTIDVNCDCLIDSNNQLRFYKPSLQDENPNKGVIKPRDESKWNNFIEECSKTRFNGPTNRFINDLLWTLDGSFVKYNSESNQYILNFKSTLRSFSSDRQVTIAIMGFDSFYAWVHKTDLLEEYTRKIDPSLLYDKCSQGGLELF